MALGFLFSLVIVTPLVFRALDMRLFQSTNFILFEMIYLIFIHLSSHLSTHNMERPSYCFSNDDRSKVKMKCHLISVLQLPMILYFFADSDQHRTLIVVWPMGNIHIMRVRGYEKHCADCCLLFVYNRRQGAASLLPARHCRHSGDVTFSDSFWLCSQSIFPPCE